MFARLLRFLLMLFRKPALPLISEHVNARSSARPVIVKPLSAEYKGIRWTPGDPEYPSLATFITHVAREESLLWGESDDHSLDAAKYVMGPPPPKPTSHYRDEDGELRPARFDRSGLSDAMLEDLAANYLQAKEDAGSSVDASEQAFIAAIRDAYGAELHRRTLRGAETVRVGGCTYMIAPTAGGFVDLVSLDEAD